MITNNDDPLSSLLSDDVQAIDREKLAKFLAPFLAIDRTSHEFSFKPGFNQLKSNTDKMQVILLGVKARAILFDLPDAIESAQLIALDVLPEGSVKSSLKRLFDSNQIKKDKDGRYFLPGYRVDEVINSINL